MLKSRVITAVILLVLFLLAAFLLPDGGWAALVTVVVLQSAAEWSRLSRFGHAEANLFWGLTLVVMLGLIWFDASHTPEQTLYTHVAVFTLSAILWLVIVPAWLIAGWKVRLPDSDTLLAKPADSGRRQGDGIPAPDASQRRVMPSVLMALVGWAVLIPTGLAMLDLRIGHPWWLLGMMSLVWVADISAYFAGRKYGKTKLAPSISPGKTWEGVAGAILGVSFCVLLAWSFSPYSKHVAFLPTVLMASWCWVGLAVLGDLFESAIKRQAGVKDSGALLPGHGGLLDRIDALTSTLPIAALAILLQHIG
ncbi:MAG TPA: phosphatidate cytidylyltransferase [Gallionella sp.]|nr:phosphatidate cytidylyltransferase [Gallionella sp.]